MRSDPSFVEKFFNQIKSSTYYFVDKIIHGNWSEKIIAIICFLLIFFCPEISISLIVSLSLKGLVLQFLQQDPPAIYSTIFGILILSLFILAALFRAFSQTGFHINSRNLRKFLISLLWIFFIFIVLSILIKLFNVFFIPEPTFNQISQGEKFLIPNEKVCMNYTSRREDIKIQTDKNVKKGAYEYYLKSFCPNDPEARIYLNNLLAQESGNSIEIAVPVPISRGDGVKDSQEILRGVALALNEWNINHDKFKVIVNIADDAPTQSKTSLESAEEVAELFADNKEILGVVGHFSSGVTEKVAEIYKSNDLVAISPTSTVVREDNTEDNSECLDLPERDKVCFNSHVFRTASNDLVHTKKLVKAKKGAKVGIVYENKNLYSRSYKRTFQLEIGLNNLVNVEEDPSQDYCNFSVPGYLQHPEDCLEKVKEADTLLLIVSSKNAKLFLNPLIKNNFELGFQEKLNLLGSDSIYREEFIIKSDRKARQDTQGMLVAVPWHRKDYSCTDDEKRLECKAAKLFRDTNPNREYPQKYQPLEINWRTASAYDATLALLNGLEIANNQCNPMSKKKCLRQKLKGVLLSDDFKDRQIKGALGIINFDKNGDRLDVDGKLGEIVKVENGKFEIYNFEADS